MAPLSARSFPPTRSDVIVRHALVQQSPGRVYAGPMEAKSWHHRAVEQHGIQDLYGGSDKARLQRLCAWIWGADYMDPITFLNIFLTNGGDNGSGWWDQKYADCSRKRTTRSIHRSVTSFWPRPRNTCWTRSPDPDRDSVGNWVKKPYVKGMYPNPASLFAWKFVYIERDPAKWDYGTPSLTD